MRGENGAFGANCTRSAHKFPDASKGPSRPTALDAASW